MENTTEISFIEISYGLASLGMMIYVIFLLLAARGWIDPTPRLTKFIRWLCLILLLMPMGMRFYFSANIILIISILFIGAGLSIKIRRMIGK